MTAAHSRPASSPVRSRVLWIGLAGTVAASIWATMVPVDDADSLALPTVSPQRPADAPVRVASLHNPDPAALPVKGAAVPDLALLPRQVPRDAASDPFSPHSWAPAAPVAAPKPAAPPLPFVVTGRMEIDGQVSYLLMEGQRTHIAPVGTQLGGFRLAEASDDQLVFVHQATGIKVPLRIPR